MDQMAHIFVNGIIGEDFFSFAGDEMGTTLADVRRQYESYENPQAVTVHINSPGGDVWEGFAIHDYFINLGIPVNTIGEGKVFSIATVILLAGDKGSREMTPNATFMIHNPMSGEWGNAEELEKVAEELRAIEGRLGNFYSQKTGQEFDLLKDMMDAETFLSADDALRLGFVDSIREPMKAVAYFGKNKSFNKNEDMAEATAEAKEALTAIGRIKALLGMKNEQAVEETPAAQEAAAEVVEQEEAPDQVAILTAEKEALEAEIAELKAKQEEAEAARAEAETKATEQAAVIAQVMEKVTALEAMPIIAGGSDPTKVVAQSPMAKTEPHQFDHVASYFAHKFGNK